MLWNTLTQPKSSSGIACEALENFDSALLIQRSLARDGLAEEGISSGTAAVPGEAESVSMEQVSIMGGYMNPRTPDELEAGTARHGRRQPDVPTRGSIDGVSQPAVQNIFFE